MTTPARLDGVNEIGTARFRFRPAERVAVAYFFYLAGITVLVHDRPRADGRLLVLATAVFSAITALAILEFRTKSKAVSIIRDWFTLLLVLAAYRSLDWFAPAGTTLAFERRWIGFDHTILAGWKTRQTIEALGGLVPFFLELAYLLTSGAGCYGLAFLYVMRKRSQADRFLLIYVLGTLLSYALIPYFPSDPPRIVFPTVDAPRYGSFLRSINLTVLGKAGIHAGVFPSAHVSSTFAAAWGIFTVLPENKPMGVLFLVYAIAVAVATVYGRYHFAIDAVAGIGISLIAVPLAKLIWQKTRPGPA